MAPIPRGNDSPAMKSPLSDPQGFMDWASQVGTQQFPWSNSKNEVDTKASQLDAKKADTNPITIPRVELTRNIPSTFLSHDDSHTDGLLSPITTSNLSNQESVTAGEPVVASIGTSGHISGPAISRTEPVFQASLIDIDPEPEQGELIKSLSPQTIKSAEGDQYIRVPREWTSGTPPTNEQIADFIAKLNLQSNTHGIVDTGKEKVENPTPTTTRVTSPVVQDRQNPFRDPGSPNRVLSQDERIVDVINPGFRQRMTGKQSSDLSTIGNIPKPLHLLSSNTSQTKGQIRSKWEKQDRHEKVISKTDVLRQVDSTLKNVTNSMLGDCSTRPTHAPTEWKFTNEPIKSKWADDSKPTHRVGIERNILGQGNDQAKKGLATASTLGSRTLTPRFTLFPRAGDQHFSGSDSDGSEL